MRNAARSDANQVEVMAALRKVGASVFSLHRVGQGCADLLVGFRGRTYLIEVKAKNGVLTPSQVKFIDSWTGDLVHVVRNIDGALRAIGSIK